MKLALSAVVLVACSAPTKAPLAEPDDAGSAQRHCLDVDADIAERASAKPSSIKIDIDGDGTNDPVFSGSCSNVGANCETYLYASNDGCAYFAGIVKVTRVSMGPRCADPPQGKRPCRLSATRMMLHGELDEYFYVHLPSGYVEAELGHQEPGPRKR